jgi:hypothetical protein
VAEQQHDSVVLGRLGLGLGSRKDDDLAGQSVALAASLSASEAVVYAAASGLSSSSSGLGETTEQLGRAAR